MDREEAERLAGTPTGLLSPIEQQQKYLAQIHLIPIQCPNCEEGLPQIDAIHLTGDHYECPHCTAKIRYVVPFVALGTSPWMWVLEPHQIGGK
jgi:hypothetical protein